MWTRKLNLVVECFGWTSEWKIVIPPRELRARDVPNNATEKGKEKQKQNHEKALQNEIVKVGSAEGLKLQTHALLKQGFNDCNLIVATELFHHLLQCLSFFPCSPPPPSPLFFLFFLPIRFIRTVLVALKQNGTHPSLFFCRLHFSLHPSSRFHPILLHSRQRL